MLDFRGYDIFLYMLCSTMFQVYPELLPEETKAREDGKVLISISIPCHHDHDRDQHPCNHIVTNIIIILVILVIIIILVILVMIRDNGHDAQVQYFSGPVFSQMVPMMLKVLKFFGGSPQSR